LKYAAMRNMNDKMRSMSNTTMESGMMEEGADMMMGKATNRNGMTLRRASELEQPVRGGHFLADFGQSQRLLIDGAGYGGSVPQVLTLMNGNAQMMLTSSDSKLFQNMDKETTEEGKINAVFLSLMNRKATDKEMEMSKKTVADGSEGFSNLIWALINTREFIFVQ
jgi:hypothetical protein